MKTRIHLFRFDVSTKDGKDAWNALLAKMKAEGSRLTRNMVWPKYVELAHDGKPVELSTDYIFDDQWTGRIEGGEQCLLWDFTRVDSDYPNIKRGYYLEMTEEMRSRRENRLRCGYCGQQYSRLTQQSVGACEGEFTLAHIDGDSFCTKCAGSDHMTPSNYKLTKVKGVDDKRQGDELTPAQTAFVEALSKELYAKRIWSGTPEARSKIFADFETRREKLLEKLHVSEWLVDNDFNMRSVYYADRQPWKFGFAWAIPVQHLPELHRRLENFPAPYKVRVVDEPEERKDPREFYINWKGEKVSLKA